MLHVLSLMPLLDFNVLICILTVYATLAMPTIHLTRLPSSPATPVPIVTAVNSLVGTHVMDPAPRK